MSGARHPLIELDWRAATQRKWADGRKRYGTAFVGLHPLEELYAEQIDGINYAREWATRDGANLDFCLSQQARLSELATETREEWLRIRPGGGEK